MTAKFGLGEHAKRMLRYTQGPPELVRPLRKEVEDSVAEIFHESPAAFDGGFQTKHLFPRAGIKTLAPSAKLSLKRATFLGRDMAQLDIGAGQQERLQQRLPEVSSRFSRIGRFLLGTTHETA